jgi:hypothetical protein
MDHLTRLVTGTLRRAYEQGATDIDAATLQTVAEVMIFPRDAQRAANPLTCSEQKETCALF